tara:strand:+ start:546 stop:731 length:186 start_codon:yes stop_codon:yes gene_type:complete
MPRIHPTNKKAPKTKKTPKVRLAPTGICPKCRGGNLIPFRRAGDHFARCPRCRREFRRQTL